MKKFFEEFKAFAMKGNVVDMAVGVVIGGAFGKIVTSLVGDIIMPAISLITGKVNLSEMAYTLSTADPENPIMLKYGMFLQNIVDFVIIALSIFIVIKLLSKLHKKKESEPETVVEVIPEPSKEEVLLTEIRDILKNK
ncbi:MAG: large-conductance mechanosensitive channel protein MscL [Clostridia bacterium]|nr:large-conductance mechanosensitive channel protein MscL [Clostridia bacterium]